MRIGLFHPALDLFGGAEVVAVIIANALAKSGYDTQVLVNRKVNKKRIEEMIGEPLDSSIRTIVNPNILQPRGMLQLYENAARTLIFKSKCDILVDTFSNSVFPWTNVCYMHFPYLNSYEFSPKFPYLKTPHLRHVISTPYAVMERNFEDYGNKLIISNSKFTAVEVKKALGADSKVLYPPIPSTFYVEIQEVIDENVKILLLQRPDSDKERELNWSQQLPV